jgi:threonine dehydratase
MSGPVAAAARIAGRVHTTPIFTSRKIDAVVGRKVFFKAECLQKTGSFKIRGALNALLSLSPDVAARGVVTHSSGNHGQGLAAAAQELGVPCTVVVPSTCPHVKVDAMQSEYGAKVVLCEPTQRARSETTASEAARTGATVVPPYDHADVIDGQGTIGLEMRKQIPGLDAVIVPTSGGGMLGGIATALADPSEGPSVKVFAVEPEGKRLGEALTQGVRVIDEDAADRPLNTVCDAMPTMAVGPVPWESVSRLVERDVLTVNDAQVLDAMRMIYSRLKLVVEPAAATGLAALLDGQAETKMGPDAQRIGVVLCGGNVSHKYLNF